MEIKRFRADWRHVVETEFDDAQYVGVKDFDRILLERDALQQRLNAVEEENDRLRKDANRIDFWQSNPSYYGGFAPSGSWSFFNDKRNTCYGETLRDAMDQLQVMHKDLENRS